MPEEFRDGVRIPLLEHGQPSTYHRRQGNGRKKRDATNEPSLYLPVVRSWGARQYLLERQPVALSRIAREVEDGQALVVMAVGWLAREGKIEFVEEGRTRAVRRRD